MFERKFNEWAFLLQLDSTLMKSSSYKSKFGDKRSLKVGRADRY
jgi:hypothetical protein